MLKLKSLPRINVKTDFKGVGNRWMTKLFGVPEDWYKQRDIVKNNYVLGIRFLKQGATQDAVLRFTLATWFNRKYAEAWLGLGRAYLMAGKRAKAEQVLKKVLILDPELKDAKKILVAIPKLYDEEKPAIKVSKGTTPALAALHQQSFIKGWSEKAIEEMLAITGTEAWVNGFSDLPMGMAMGRALGEQYEILTIAVAPEWRRRSLARQLLEAMTSQAKKTGAKTLFLEVQEDNKAARAFYQRAGYNEVNRRKDYYKQEDGSYKDAVVMSKELA